MEDLGEVVENFVETFGCIEGPGTRLPEQVVLSKHGNLLASSNLYGYLFAAVRAKITVYTHASLREGGAKPVAVVDLENDQIRMIHSIALGVNGTIILHVATSSGTRVIILNISALVEGKVDALPSPSGDVSAFSAGEALPSRSSQVVATLQGGDVQLHVLSTEGTTATRKIDMSNARCIAISPDDMLLAVGTERGSVVVYNTKTDGLCTTIVEVESGWVPFAVHFTDERSVLVSYNCDTEVRHVVWQLSSDGETITGHSPLGEICLAFLPFDDDDQTGEAPAPPTITCITLQDWNMCVVGSSMSSDVEVIRKTDSGWEVWKFDEGKSATLPTNEADDDTHCVGLSFDLNNTIPIPGPDAASPNINPMPRVIVYTSDSMLLPFSLIDSSPGVKCTAVKNAVERPPVKTGLRSLHSVLNRTLSSDLACVPDRDATVDGVISLSSNRNKGKRMLTLSHSIYDASEDAVESRRTIANEVTRFASNGSRSYSESSKSLVLPSSGPATFGSSKPLKAAQEIFSRDQSIRVNSSHEHFSTTKWPDQNEQQKSTEKSHGVGSKESDYSLLRAQKVQAVQKPSVILAPSLDAATFEASSGKLLGLLKSITTEMSEELRVSVEAEQVVSMEISEQNGAILSVVKETKENLAQLLQCTRSLFSNEACLRKRVSDTLSKVLSLSREYEKMSLEFRVKELDGFSTDLRAEEKEVDRKIAAKEAEVIRSLSSIEERLHADAEINTRNTRSGSSEIIQHIYSSLSLQDIRINRVRSLLSALNERMETQDKGERLSHLGLSLARLEKLNIRDEDVAERTPEDRTTGELGSKEEAQTGNNVNQTVESKLVSHEVDDTQLLSPEIQIVMRRLAMSGGRSKITNTLPPSHVGRRRPDSAYEGTSATSVRGDLAMANDMINVADFGDGHLDVVKTSLSSTFSTLKRNTETAMASETADIAGAITVTSQTTTGSEREHTNSIASQYQLPKVDTNLKTFSKNTPLSSGNAISSEATAFTFDSSQQSMSQIVGPSADLPPMGTVHRSQIRHTIDNRASISPPFAPASESYSKQNTQSERASEVDSVSDQSTWKRPKEKMLNREYAFEKTDGTALASKPVSFAIAPADNGFLSSTPKPSLTIPSKATFAKPPPSTAVQVATLPPNDDDSPKKPSAQSPASRGDAEALRNSSTSNLFASLPPDSETISPGKKSDDNENKILGPSSEQKATPPRSSFFGALPPEPSLKRDRKEHGGDGEAGKPPFATSSFGSFPAPPGPSTNTELLKTSDLFASLPPADGTNEENGITALSSSSPFQTESETPSERGDSKTTATVTAIDISENDRYATQQATSIFSDASSTVPSATNAFGSSSLFGANSHANQSSAMAARKMPASADGSTSEDSDEESERFGRGMETTTGGNDFFGTSSPQGSQRPYGFGSKAQNEADVASFGDPSAASAFGSSSQSQPFGQSTPLRNQSQTGFGALANPQQSMPSAFQSAQPAFGAASSLGGSSVAPAFGAESTFGAPSPMGASNSFGNPAQLGASPLSFGASNNNPTFGGGMSASKFGESTFGVTPSFGGLSPNSGAGGFGTASQGGSPFGNVAGGTGFSGASGGGDFGGASGGGSGFAALAGGQSGSSFAALAGGQSGPLVFGNGGGPPSFTSAAFSQRRA